MNGIIKLLVLLGHLLPSLCAADYVNNQFVSVKLAHGASISIPKSWKVMQGNELRAMETATGAVLDLSGYAAKTRGGETLLISNFPDQDFYAAVVATSAAMPGVPSNLPDLMSDAQMRSAETTIRKGTEEIQARIGWQISEWTPLRKIVLSGKPVMHISYRKSSKESESRVHLYKIFGTDRFYELVLSTRLSAESVNNFVLERIAKSFVVH